MEVKFTIDNYLKCAYYASMRSIEMVSPNRKVRVAHIEPYDAFKSTVYDYDGNVQVVGNQAKLEGFI